MNITGDAYGCIVKYDKPHGEWKNQQTVLSVDACTITLNQDQTISIKSKQGKLKIAPGNMSVFIYPGWYDPTSEFHTNTKNPVHRNQVFACYEVKQSTKNRTGYVMFFGEKQEK